MGLSPNGVAFWRLMLSFPLYFLLYKFSHRNTLPINWKSFPWMILLPGIFFAFDLASWHWSFEFTSLANATLEANLAVIIVGFVGWIWFKEKLNWLYPVGAITAITGLALLVGFGSSQGHANIKGDMLGILTAFCYSGYLLSVKVLSERFQVLPIMISTSLVGSLLLGVISFLAPGKLLPETMLTWIPLLCLSLVSQLGGQTLIAYGLKTVSASFAGALLLWQPIMTAILGWIIFGQSLDLLQINGIRLRN